MDIVIDDGSHVNEHVLTSFKVLFPLLKNGGVYVVEDVQTTYDDGYGGDSQDLNNPSTTMNFFKSRTDCVNYEEIINPENKISCFEKQIVSMHFYRKLIFIYKK